MSRARKFGRISLLVFVMPLAGCSAYLYNPGRATATADLQKNFGAMSTPAYFDAQDKNLTDFAVREDKALAELLVSSRDYRLLNIIKPATTVADPKKTKEMRLTDLVRGDLATAYGGRGTLAVDEAQTLMTGRFVKDLAVRTTAFNERRVATAVRSYKAAGGTLSADCAAVINANQGPTPPNHADPKQAERYGKLIQACQALEGRQSRAKDCDPSVTAGGNLAAICQAIAALSVDQATRKEQLVSAEKALKEASKAATPDNPAAGLKQATDFLESIDGLATDDKLAKVLKQIDDLFGSELEKSLDELDDKEKPVLPQASEALLQALTLMAAIRDYEMARAAKQLDQPSALLIGLAKVRHDRNLLAIDIDAANQHSNVLLAEASLLRAQLYYLAQAQQALCGKRFNCEAVLSGKTKPSTAAFDEALSYYVRSQNAGSIPFEVLRFREIQIRRATALKVARATDAGYRALIKPAIDQLAAYGANGIKPETLADFAAGLPVSGSILVN